MSERLTDWEIDCIDLMAMAIPPEGTAAFVDRLIATVADLQAEVEALKPAATSVQAKVATPESRPRKEPVKRRRRPQGEPG